MVDIACSIRKRLAVKSVAVIQMKNIGIAGFQATSALFASNLFSNVGNNPGTFGDILHCKQSLPVNTGVADTYHISPLLGATSAFPASYQPSMDACCPRIRGQEQEEPLCLRAADDIGCLSF